MTLMEAARIRDLAMCLRGALLLPLVCSSCASIWTHADPDPDKSRMYSGTRRDARLLAHPDEIDPAGLKVVAYPLLVVDTPLSAAIDTVLLPLDLARGKPEAPRASDAGDR